MQRRLNMFLGGGIDAIQNAFQVALDNVQGGTQFVGNVGGQVAPLLVGARQFRGHAVEGACQTLKLA